MQYNTQIVNMVKPQSYGQVADKSLPSNPPPDCMPPLDGSYFMNDGSAAQQIPPCSEFNSQPSRNDSFSSTPPTDTVVPSPIPHPQSPAPAGSILQPPKRVRSAYNYFSQEYFDERSRGAPQTQESIQNAAEQWKRLSPEEKQKYEELSREDRKRHEHDVAEYSGRFRKYGLEPVLSKRGGAGGGV